MNYCKLATLILTSVLALPDNAAEGRNLVILHTNDTHSQIDPDDRDGLGGIARRKVVVDSVRAAEDNVLVVDAGDAVQGTLYFNLFGGEVEQKAMNKIGYDLRILGNHEFDNGIDALGKMLSEADATFLSTNYDLKDTPLADKFKRYTIKEIDGKRIGFIAINIDPKGIISDGNYNGLVYLDAMESADAAAWWLKNIEKCDMVVVVTHIGYDPSMPPGDKILAENSRNIDVIIGGHSHDLINPMKNDMQWRIPNKDGRDVLVAQVGKQGKNVGKITIDLDNFNTDYDIIRIDKRLDSRIDTVMVNLIAPYRAGVDSLMQVPVGRTSKELGQLSDELLNWTTDIVKTVGDEMADNVDFAILNKGGLRRGLPKGKITEGQIMTMMPFDNRITVIDIKGADLLEAFRQMATLDGNGISNEVRVVYEKEGNDIDDVEIESVTINGRPLDPNRTYRVATIDYLANGGDYMPTLANHKQIAVSTNVLYNDVLRYIRSLKGRRINPSGTPRFVLEND